MLFHQFPIFRSANVFKNELSLEHIIKHVRESLSQTSDKLSKLQFISQDFRRSTQIESSFSIHARRRHIKGPVKFFLKVLNICNLSEVLTSRKSSNFSSTSTFSSGQPEVFKHRHMLFLIFDLSSGCIIY